MGYLLLALPTGANVHRVLDPNPKRCIPDFSIARLIGSK